MAESADAMILYTAVIHSIPAVAELLGISKMPILANMVISNVPLGLPGRNYLGGAEVEMILPLSVLAPGQSLNITAATYDKGLQIAFLGIAREFSDIGKLADYTVAAFEELRAAFAGLTTNKVAVKKTAARKLTAVKKPAVRKPPRAAAAKPARAMITPAEAGNRPPARLATNQRAAARRPAPKRVARKAVAA
jgi:hypothetical protein